LALAGREPPPARIQAQRGCKVGRDEGPLGSAPETLGEELQDCLTESATARVAFETVISLVIDTERLVEIAPLLRHGDDERQLRTAAERGMSVENRRQQANAASRRAANEHWIGADFVRDRPAHRPSRSSEYPASRLASRASRAMASSSASPSTSRQRPIELVKQLGRAHVRN